MSSRGERTRRRILTSARQLLEKRPAQDVTLEDVAEAAGVTRQSVYLHFGSRVGLLLALVENVDASEGLERHSQAHLRAGTGPEKLRAFVRMIGDYTPRIYAIAKALDDARRQDPEANAAWENRMMARRAGCSAIIEQLNREGSLANGWTVGTAAEALWALTAVSTWEDLVVNRGWSKRRYTDALQRIVLRSFVSDE